LTAMDIANASLLDEATAAAEAMALAHRQSKAKSNVFLVDQRVHPQTIDVLLTRAGYQGIEISVLDCSGELPDDYFGILVQYPDTHGHVVDYRALVEKVHHKDAVVVVADTEENGQAETGFPRFSARRYNLRLQRPLYNRSHC